VLPWWLTRWRPGAALPVPVRVTGGLLTASGSAVLAGSFAQFAVEGRGTPAPPAPTGQLVVHGLYRHVRNPMYLAVLAVITGQALLLGRPVLPGYAAAVGGAFTAFVYGYEQPALARRYGTQYEAYRQAVPGWWPRHRAAHAREREGGGLPGAAVYAGASLSGLPASARAAAGCWPYALRWVACWSIRRAGGRQSPEG
jgi:Phospholipid methyltransferase